MVMPKISIIMCNYNYSNFLHDSLGSIAKQTQPPFECLVIDDCSTDNSVEIIKKYQKEHSFIKLIQNKKNKGVMHNINYGLKVAQGDYVCFLSSDDTWSKDFVKYTTQLLTKHPNVGLCCSLPCSIHENGTFSHVTPPPTKNVSEYYSPTSMVSVLEKGFFIAGHTSAINRKSLIEANGMIPELKWHCDWFALLTIGFRHGICFTPEKLAFMRIHSKSYSSSYMIWKEQKKVIQEILKILHTEKFQDVKNKFFESKSLLYLPFATSYLITHSRYWFSLSFKIWKDILFTFFLKKRLHLIQKIKNFFRSLLK